MTSLHGDIEQRTPQANATFKIDLDRNRRSHIGVALVGGRVLWLETRTPLPIYIPVSLKPGHVRTQEFAVNLNKPYLISIEAKKRLPFDTLNCLLGVSTDPGNVLGKKCDESAVIDTNWVLTSAGKIVAKGRSDQPYGRWSDESVEGIIGSFKGKSGGRYILDVAFLKDGSALAMTDPHLKVEVTPAFYEDVMWGAIFWVWPWVAVALLGLALLAAAGVCAWRQRQSAVPR